MRILLLCVAVVGCSGSGGTTPSTAPDTTTVADVAAAADTPATATSTFTFPASVAIALDKLAQNGKADSAGGKYAVAIAQGPGLAGEMQDVVDSLLKAFHAVTIPATATTTTFDTEVAFGSGNLALHFDFGDFGGQGCSGNTGAVPVCFRMWVAGERFMSGRFDTLATASTAGAGRFTFKKIASFPGGENGTAITAVWSQVDPASRALEMWWGVPSDDAKSFVAMRHATVSAVGPEATAVKTVNIQDDLIGVPTPSSLRYVARYREDGDLWSGLMDSVGAFVDMLGLVSFPATCASIATGNEATGCDAAGLAITDVPALSPATDADVTLPAGFPEKSP